MALILKDRVQETTTTTGTGTLTLGGAVTGYQSFSAIGNANTTYYAIYANGGSEWEVGIGTYTASGTTLSRDTVLSSSNSGSLVSFSAGTKNVWCDYPAARAGYIDTNSTLNSPVLATSGTTSTTPVLTYNASNTNFALGGTVSGSYLQAVMQNKSGTANASTNWAVSNDLGTDSTYYGEFGMNSSVFSASTPADFFSINNGIYFSGHDGDVTVGSGNGFKHYLAWGTTGQSAHVINASGAIGLNTNLGTTPALSGTTGFGTSGQVLTSAGSAATPTWTTPAVGTVTSVSGTTGRITSTGGATPVIDLASGVATAGTTGSATLIPVVTIDTYGRVTSITTASNPQGTVTSVTGTAPVVSSGGATPAISMAAANTTTNGYLTSTDWTTFNSKGSGTVTSVAAITLGTTGTDLSSTVATGTTTPVITLQVPTASASNRGVLSAADWTTFNNKGSGTVTSVTGTAPVVSSGGATPAISMAAATTSVSGYLTSTDWTTFNGKQAALVSGTNIKTINTNSILGSGDLTISATPAGSTTQVQYNNAGAFGASSSFTYASSTLTAPNLSASNGLVVNSATVSASYSIPSGSNAMSVGPVTVASGQSVTVASGNRWVVL